MNDTQFYNQLKQKVIQIRLQHSNEYYDEIQDEDNPIIYDGNTKGKIFVIARDLGLEQVKQAKPLIGKAGQLFRSGFKYLQHYQNQVYMTNLVPYKPKNNMVFPEQIRKAYNFYLIQQIQFVNPMIIVSLGYQAYRAITNYKFNGSILKILKEKKFELSNYILQYEFQRPFFIVPMCHPSYIIRNGGNIDKSEGYEYLGKRFIIVRELLQYNN